MNLEPDDRPEPIQALGEVIADVTICARQAEALAQNTDLWSPAACKLLGALGTALKASADRLGRQVLPALVPPPLVVKDGEGEASGNGIAGDPPTAAAEEPHP